MYIKFACLSYFKTTMSSRTASSKSESLPTITKHGTENIPELPDTVKKYPTSV